MLDEHKSGRRCEGRDRGRAERDLNQRAEELGRPFGRLPRLKLTAGDPAMVLLQEAREQNGARTLIAVGTRGLGPARRLRLSSVSTKVLRVRAAR
jgi:nucleotide-binding universal stress UspA family protein